MPGKKEEKKMKKLMVAVLVLAGVFAYAKTTTYLDLENAPFDPDTHMFTIEQDGALHIQLFQPKTVLGQDAEFGYYLITNDETAESGTATKRIVLGDKNDNTEAPHITGNDAFVISDLKKDDKVLFYVIPTQSVGELDTFDVISTPGNSADGHTAYGVEWGNQDNVSFLAVDFQPAPTPDPTPSGQPLPGALTTMLIAGGCAAYLKRRKSARK